MKEPKCLSYSKNTETEIREIGTAYGKPLYREKEIIISEYCSFFKKLDDFDCSDCIFKKFLIKEDTELEDKKENDN